MPNRKDMPFYKNAGLVDAGKIVKTATDAVAAARPNVEALRPLNPGNYQKVGNVQMPGTPAMPKVPNGHELASTIVKNVQDGLKNGGVGSMASAVGTALGGARRASQGTRMTRTPRVPRTPRMPRAPRA